MSLHAYDIIRAGITTEVKKVRFFSVLADKVSSHSVEHLALCLHFVNGSVIFERTSSQTKRVRASDITMDEYLGRTWIVSECEAKGMMEQPL